MSDPIERVRDRIAALYDQVVETKTASPEMLEASFDSVSDILEEAQRFYEELTVRNEELITARQALEDERRRYQELFEFAPDAYLVTDANGMVTEANHAAALMLAIRQQHLIGKPLRIFVASEARALYSRLINGQHGANQVEIPIVPRTGIRITTEVTMMVVPGMGGKPQALRWLLRDVSEREKERQTLAASENRFRTIFQDAHVGMQLVGLDGTIIESNRAFQEMTGYSPVFCRGKEALSLVHSEDQEKYDRVLKDFSQGNIDEIRLELRYQAIDGQAVWARVSISLLRNPQMLPENTVHIIENITHEKQAASEMAEGKRKFLEGIEAERLRLAQELHDGPMQDLYAAVFKLSPAEEIGATREYAQAIQETQEMLKLVAGTLRSICGELRPPTLSHLGLDRTIRAHSDNLRGTNPNLLINLNLVEDKHTIPADMRIVLFRVYQQCIMNVLRHAYATEVTVNLLVDDHIASLEIRDNGRGFQPPKNLVALTRQGHYGLAGINERVRALDGHLEIDTTPGKGTRVKVTLPLLENENA